MNNEPTWLKLAVAFVTHFAYWLIGVGLALFVFMNFWSFMVIDATCLVGLCVLYGLLLSFAGPYIHTQRVLRGRGALEEVRVRSNLNWLKKKRRSPKSESLWAQARLLVKRYHRRARGKRHTRLQGHLSSSETG